MIVAQTKMQVDGDLSPREMVISCPGLRPTTPHAPTKETI